MECRKQSGLRLAISQAVRANWALEPMLSLEARRDPRSGKQIGKGIINSKGLIPAELGCLVLSSGLLQQ